MKTLCLLFALTALLGTGCGRQAPDPAADSDLLPGNTYLVRARLLGEYSAAQLQQRTGVPLPLQYPVRVYRLVYKTKNTDSTELLASGALLVPVTPDNRLPHGLLSQQHGTITRDADAPSYYGSGSEAYSYGSALAALGYGVACPDYIGYGESKQVPHPYEHRRSLASASLDMIRASREFFRAKEITNHERLFITGYSEGGFATLSLQKLIEEKFAGEMGLVASSCGAGAYHKSRFMRFLLNEETTGDSGFNQSYLWTLLTYNRVYGLGKPASYYFKSPYADDIELRQQNAQISGNLRDIFTETFKQEAIQPDNPFAQAVADNDVHDWRPRVPTRLYHGTADTFVFYFNSEDAYQAMQARGAEQVDLFPLPDRNHFTAVPEFALGTYVFFQSFRQP